MKEKKLKLFICIYFICYLSEMGCDNMVFVCVIISSLEVFN